MSRDCPYCGASFVEGWSGRIFKCGTDIDRVHGDFRVEECYKREITQLRTELLRCYNVIPGIEKVEKLPAVILGGCVSDTVHAFTTGQIEDKRRLNIKLDSLMQCVDEVSEAATDVQDWNGTRLGDAIQLLQAAKASSHA